MRSITSLVTPVLSLPTRHLFLALFGVVAAFSFTAFSVAAQTTQENVAAESAVASTITGLEPVGESTGSASATSGSVLPLTTPAPAPTAASNLTVSPITLPLETTPGVTTSANVKVRNNGSETEYLKTELFKFTADSSGERPVILSFEEADEFRNWLTVSEPTFTVRPGEWKTVTVTFAPPESAALNYFYVLAFNRQATPDVQPGETAYLGAPAILVLSNVLTPSTKRELQLARFSVPKVFFEFLPAQFSIAVKNTGNSFLAPTGNIFIDGNGKKDIAILDINPGAGNVLPGSERTYETEWIDGFPVWIPKEENKEIVRTDDGTIVQTLSWDFSKADRLRIGKYTANLLLVYDNGERDVPIESTVSFWVVPWRMMLGALTIALLALLGLRSTLTPIWKKLLSVIKK